MKLVIAGGGTGGHIFSGVAVAQALKKIDPSADILFVGTALGLEKTAVPKAGFNIAFIQVSGLKGHSIKRKLRSLFSLPLAVFHSIHILRKFKADAVLGVGGYASGPTLLAAWVLRIPTAICEQNSIPGFTNEILAYFSKQIFGAFEKTASFFPARKFFLVGNPLRQDLILTPHSRSFSQKPYTLVVLGGSLGATPLNELLPPTLEILKSKGLLLNVIHQSGRKDADTLLKNYHTRHIQAEVFPFIDNMARVYQKADLLICRAGATTCAEVTALGVPSIMIPFPQAIYDHQTENAKELTQAGAALSIPQVQATPSHLAEAIWNLCASPDTLASMSNAAFKLARVDAAQKIAQFALRRFKTSG